MKKLLGIVVLGLLLTSCSNKEEEEVKLLERCANIIFIDNKVFWAPENRDGRWNITKGDLQQKLRNYLMLGKFVSEKSYLIRCLF